MEKKDKKNTSHDVQDKPLIEVDPTSFAALVANPKYIKTLPRDAVAGFIQGVNDSDWKGEGDPDDDEPGDISTIPGPGIEDIFIKYGNAYEKPDSSKKYGTLYNDTGQTSKVNLEFKIMIPLDLIDTVVGIEILSENEVIAAI
jgi:hypothetical protein